MLSVEPKNEKQRLALDALYDTRISLVGLFGPTGTGKSLLALAVGASQVAANTYSKLVVSKPLIDVVSGEPARIVDQREYEFHILDYITDVLSIIKNKDKIIDQIKDKIEIVQPFYIRGRTFDNSFIILDDAQNLPAEIAVETITRLGRNSKLVLIGDPILQTRMENNAAILGRNILREEEDSFVIDFGTKDIVRPGARRGLRLLFELRLRERRLAPEEKRVIESLRLYAPDADIITVVSLLNAKKQFNIAASHVPDALVIVKRGHVARAIGTRGERIRSVEEDTGLSLRVIELALNFKEYFRAIHPVAWIHSKIIDADLEGPVITVYVRREDLGPLLGQKGAYAKFMNYFFKTCFNAEMLVREASSEKKKRRKH